MNKKNSVSVTGILGSLLVAGAAAAALADLDRSYPTKLADLIDVLVPLVLLSYVILSWWSAAPSPRLRTARRALGGLAALVVAVAAACGLYLLALGQTDLGAGMGIILTAWSGLLGLGLYLVASFNGTRSHAV